MTRGRFRFFYFFIFLIFLPLLLQSQTRFSIEGTSNSEMKFNTVRALVMGISNYKNYPLEKQLEYAEDDAMAFYKFLLNRPDIIKPQNIQAFFNEEATNKVRIKTTLYNLIVKESEKNDLVILYFAGHGDVQNFESSGEEGFLLLHNVSRDGIIWPRATMLLKSARYRSIYHWLRRVSKYCLSPMPAVRVS